MTARAAASEQTKATEERRWITRAKVPLAFLGGALSLSLALFQVHDRLWPPATVHGGEVVAADVVELGVSYGSYVHDHPLLFPDPKATLLRAGDAVTKRGAVVDVVLRMDGLRGRACRAVYTVYRMPLHPVLRSKEALAKCTAHVQDGDEGGWPAWVELPKTTMTQRYFVRFDLYDDNGLFIGPGKNTQVFAWNGESG